MFEKFHIILFGTQPVANISDKDVERLITRDFGDYANEVKQILRKLNGSPKGKNRSSAAILKLANKDIHMLDKFVTRSNNDFRDIIAQAEYPRCFNMGFEEFKNKMKQVYLADWKDYSNWLNKP